MKSKLIRLNTGRRHLFFATFKRNIITAGPRGISQKLQFENVRDENYNLISNYIVFEDNKGFLDLNLVEGDIISFYARQLEYGEIYPNFRYNCDIDTCNRLYYPTRVKKLVKVAKRLNIQEHSEYPTNYKCKINIMKR